MLAEPPEAVDDEAEEVPDPEEMELLMDLRLGLAPGTNLLGDFVGRVGRPILGFCC